MGYLHEHTPLLENFMHILNVQAHMTRSISFSVNLLLRDLDECLWRPVEEQQLREELLLHHQLATLTNQVDVKAEFQQKVRHRQLNEHDAE